jgi:hypothetical protein
MLSEALRRDPRCAEGHLQRGHLELFAGDKVRCFRAFGTIFRKLVWKTPIFFWRAVPKNPNASYDSVASSLQKETHRVC